MSVYDYVTERIVAEMQAGKIPWRKPWRGFDDQNLLSGKQYRGINVLLVDSSQYQYPFWLTYNQSESLKSHVKKNEKSTMVVFFKVLNQLDEDGNQVYDRKGNEKTIPMLCYYRIFNVAQCAPSDDLNALISKRQGELKDNQKIIRAENVFKNMPNKPGLTNGGGSAYYKIEKDTINLPQIDKFDDSESYYMTLFHEMTHATGHPSRLARFDSEKFAAFGSQTYSKEELVAEIGACFLGTKSKLDFSIQNSAAYLNGWITKLKGDSRLIVQAASSAQKSTDYILGGGI